MRQRLKKSTSSLEGIETANSTQHGSNSSSRASQANGWHFQVVWDGTYGGSCFLLPALLQQISECTVGLPFSDFGKLQFLFAQLW
jgi:hypothetical protein